MANVIIFAGTKVMQMKGSLAPDELKDHHTADLVLVRCYQPIAFDCAPFK